MTLMFGVPSLKLYGMRSPLIPRRVRIKEVYGLLNKKTHILL